MKPSPEKLAAEAEATGFRVDVLEKVARLLGLLDALRSHPFLEKRLVLKAVLPLGDSELAFLDALLQHGRIEPELMTDDRSLADRIRRQPLLQWKALKCPEASRGMSGNVHAQAQGLNEGVNGRAKRQSKTAEQMAEQMAE